MATPRQYLSFSQMTLFEMSPERYAEKYLYNEKQRISRNMQYGSQFAESLENGEATGDPLLDLMASKVPKFELMDRPITDPNGKEIYFERDKENIKVPVLKNQGNDIPLLAVPDSTKPDLTAFKEYKTSVRKWTQRMVDESGQISFYATTIWLMTKKLPSDIELVNVKVAYQEDGRLAPTGGMYRFPTRRTMSDVIKMTSRIRHCWRGIRDLYERELF